ncbi:MAG: FMN-binding glutamate synthase family protein [Gammaproteobacteria bacterium]|jgi:glutamate synthase domain-containing protein 2
MRIPYYFSLAVLWTGVAVLATFWRPALYGLWFVVPYTLLGLYDILLSNHNVLRNYPVIGHLRYMMEFISPEIRQYFIETNQSGRPYNRETRNLVYARAEGLSETLPFGTQQEITAPGFAYAQPTLAPTVPSPASTRILIGGPDCTQPYDASRLNISGMSFGALSYTAIQALNRGAQLGGFAHNTGEGGISPYHHNGGDLIWQIGTAYFGCRTPQGRFDPEAFARLAGEPQVRMIELKLSQGAKPSHGGMLPAAKISPEIARIRGIPEGEDCISPPMHNTFDSPFSLLQFIARLRALSGGKPVGIKLCIGRREEFMGICKAMLETGITPDFISVDGAEGGTGAAPVEFTDNLGTPLNEALVFVHSCLNGIGLRDRIRIIASGKIATGFDMIEKIALGADLCSMARPMMFALGCIQALRCNRNTCPSGVATQDRRRARAIDVTSKAARVCRFHQATMRSFVNLCGALGVDDPDELQPHHIMRRMAEGTPRTCAEIYPYLETGALLGGSPPPAYAAEWRAASAQHF